MRCRASNVTRTRSEKGYISDEIVPMKVTMNQVDKKTGAESLVDVSSNGRVQSSRHDARGTREVAAGVRRGRRSVTAGNASQLSDGASMTLFMSAERAESLGLKPMGIFRGFTVAGCEPDEMGIGPVFSVPRLLKNAGLKIKDIDLWDLNEAFASQCLYCRDALGIDNELYNVNGGSICDRSSVRDDRLTADRTDAARTEAPQEEIRRRDDVHRRRPGRNRVSSKRCEVELTGDGRRRLMIAAEFADNSTGPL